MEQERNAYLSLKAQNCSRMEVSCGDQTLPGHSKRVLTVYDLPDDFVRHGEACRRVCRRDSIRCSWESWRKSVPMSTVLGLGGASDLLLEKNLGT
jgi:hypothetical protein